jgi:long-chain fatty acid transport protein
MLGLIVCSTSSLLAGGIDNKHNYSAEYVRTLNRNAATDSADAVVYNPAGVVKMEDGLYLNISGQYALKDYSNAIGGKKYSTDEPDFVPSLFALYTQDRWAAYAAMTIPCGGGKVDYENGSATTLSIGQATIQTVNNQYGVDMYDGTIKDQCMEGESFYYGFTVGGAYALNDALSVSLGVRYIDTQIERKGSATLGRTAIGVAAGVPETYCVDYEETGDGWGGIVGVNIAPTKALNIGARYETKVSLDLQTKEKKDDIDSITNGSKRNRDLPALLGLGVACNIRPNLKAETNFTYYLNKDVDWDDVGLTTTADETKKSHGYDLGIALEYAFSPKVKGSLGYLYTETGIDPDNMCIEAPELDAQSLAVGLAYEATCGLDFNLGVLIVFYDEATTTADIKLEKKDMVIALGLQYRL